jgi:uncharacterized RDD family membrane protein YckC
MASTDFQVLTPERVSLQYDIAGIGSRGGAVAVDSLIQIALGIVVVLGFSSSAISLVTFLGRGSALAQGFVIAVVALTFFAISIGYFILFEIIWSGQTPGKRLLGLRVLRENGYPLRPVDATIRNVVRLVDGLPLGYAVGVLVMLFNSRARRLGDFAAGTIVVREGPRAAFSFESASRDAPVGATLRPADATLVRDFLVRRAGMNPAARATLAERLAGALSARYGFLVDTDPEAFLERLGA